LYRVISNTHLFKKKPNNGRIDDEFIEPRLLLRAVRRREQTTGKVFFEEKIRFESFGGEKRRGHSRGKCGRIIDQHRGESGLGGRRGGDFVELGRSSRRGASGTFFVCSRSPCFLLFASFDSNANKNRDTISKSIIFSNSVLDRVFRINWKVCVLSFLFSPSSKPSSFFWLTDGSMRTSFFLLKRGARREYHR
jgi:hypothetical protein